MSTQFGCKKNTVEPQVDHTTKYIPLDIGQTWTYQMDSIHFSGFSDQNPDTFSYLIKNVVADSFTNNAGYKEYRIERWYKIDSMDWKFARNFSEYRTELEYIRKDFDLREIVMSLPISFEKLWDGNLLNTRDEADFYYEEVHVPNTINDNIYDSTSTIIQDENQNFITSFIAEEIYAANTGLIYCEQERLKNLGTKTQKGFKYTLQLISFEK